MPALLIFALFYGPFPQETDLDRILRISKQERRTAKTEKEYSQSVQRGRKALQDYIKEHPAANDVAKATWFHAESFLYSKEYLAAIRAFDDFARTFPEEQKVSTAKFAAAEICMRLEKDSEARKRLLSWKKEYPDDPRAFQVRIFLAAILIFEKKFSEAANSLSALRLENKGTPQEWTTAMQLAACYHIAEQNGSAKNILKEIIADCPDKQMQQTAQQYLREYSRLNQPVPSQKETDKEGQTLHLAELKGNVIVLYFFASRLPITQSEVEFLQKTRKQFEGKDLQILGICVDPDKRDFLAFRKAYNIPWKLFYDGGGRHGYLARLYEVEGIPDLRVMDRNGLVRFYNVSGRDLRIAVEKLLSESR